MPGEKWKHLHRGALQHRRLLGIAVTVDRMASSELQPSSPLLRSHSVGLKGGQELVCDESRVPRGILTCAPLLRPL